MLILQAENYNTLVPGYTIIILSYLKIEIYNVMNTNSKIKLLPQENERSAEI